MSDKKCEDAAYAVAPPPKRSLSDELNDYFGNKGKYDWDRQYKTTPVPDISDFFTKAEEEFYLVAVPSQNIKQVGNLKSSLENFKSLVYMYGMDAVTVTKLDKESAKVLYGEKK